MADIHHDARVPRPPRHLEQLAVVVDDLHVEPGEAVREDIARPQKRKDLLDRGRAERDVHHQRQLALLGRAARKAQRLQAVVSDGRRAHPHLDAADEVAVLVQLRAAEARVAIEKPFGRDLASARALNELCTSVPRVVDLPHRSLPRQGAGPEPALFPLRQLVARAAVEPRSRPERPDHDGRSVRRAGARQLLRGDRRDPRRHPEPSAAGHRDPRDGRAGRARRRGDPRREGARPQGDRAARSRARRARPVPRLPRRAGRRAGLRRSRRSPRSSCASTPGAGRACRSSSARASACPSPRPR